MFRKLFTDVCVGLVVLTCGGWAIPGGAGQALLAGHRFM
jgi:hypothetical protein